MNEAERLTRVVRDRLDFLLAHWSLSTEQEIARDMVEAAEQFQVALLQQMRRCLKEAEEQFHEKQQ